MSRLIVDIEPYSESDCPCCNDGRCIFRNGKCACNEGLHTFDFGKCPYLTISEQRKKDKEKLILLECLTPTL